MRQLHAAGLVPNGGPRPATRKRELARLARAVHRVLWISRTRLVVWTRRDRRQPGANPRWVALERLRAPTPGWALLLWSRALVALHAPQPQAKGRPNA